MQIVQQLHGPDYMIPELDPNFLDGHGLGLSEDDLKDIGETLAVSPTSPGDMAAALQPFSPSDRQVIIAAFLAFEGNPAIVGHANELLDVNDMPKQRKGIAITWAVLGTASMAASAFHGYRRNQSVGWAVVWALMGGMFPILTPAVALAQGFGQTK